MNILYLEHYAGSPEMGMEFRPYYLAREWVKAGHDVRIAAGDYSHLRGKNPAVSADFETQETDGITYVWVKTGTYSGNGVSRALSMFRFVWKLRRRASRIAREWKPDVVICSSTYPMDTWAGQKIRRKSGAKLLHEVHDMWPITLIELGGMKKSHPFVMLNQAAENSFCRHSDGVVSLLCAAKDYFVAHGMAPEKFHVVMNGVVREEWEHPAPLPAEHAEILSRLRAEGKFIICFFGSVTKSYAVEYLLRALDLAGDSRAAAVIVGEGNLKDTLREAAGEKDGKQVFFLPRIPKAAVPSLTEAVDCSYVGALRNDMFRFGICMNKLFDAMMAGKPVLYAVDAPNNLIRDYGCGVSVEAENAEALAEGIRTLLAMSPQERQRLGENGRRAVLEHFTYEKLAEQFLEVMRNP